MKYYGNVMNRLEENKGSKIPEVGDRVTEYFYSDRVVYEIVEVISEKNFKMIRMNAKNKSGYGVDDWELSLDKNGYKHDMVFRYGKWYERITYTKEGLEKILKEDGCVLVNKNIFNKAMEKGVAYKYVDKKIRIGVSDYYYDWTF